MKGLWGAGMSMAWSDFIKPFDTITLGNYWQSDDVSKEPIEWIVLRDKEDRMLLLSKYCLDCVPYCVDRQTYTWRKCFLRKWLNEFFFEEAFSAKEHEQILYTDTRTDTSGYYKPKADTADMVFLLSCQEAWWCFRGGYGDILTYQKRLTSPTQWAFQQGAIVHKLEYGPVTKPYFLSWADNRHCVPEISYWHCAEDDDKSIADGAVLEKNTETTRWACSWFLRDSFHSGVARFHSVWFDGGNNISWFKEQKGVAVRPAMWIKK
jgi:hypothetical protein